MSFHKCLAQLAFGTVTVLSLFSVEPAQASLSDWWDWIVPGSSLNKCLDDVFAGYDACLAAANAEYLSCSAVAGPIPCLPGYRAAQDACKAGYDAGVKYCYGNGPPPNSFPRE